MNVNEILQQLTVEEKVKLLVGKSAWSLNGVERLGVPEINVTDGPHGVRWSVGFDFTNSTQPATSLPIEAAMSATWNDELVSKAGKMAALECHHYDVSVLLGPGANGKRSPLAGRNFEYYSEDPYLSGKMAAAFINGVQSEGIGTSLKHFAVNDQETRRMSVDVSVDERALREIYLRPFEIAIKESNPWTIMGAYNRVRGAYACENDYLLIDVLRKEWGYDGLVMTDWGACINKAASHINGLDLEMPGPGGRENELIEAYKNGELTEEVLNDRVRNVLNLIRKSVENKKDVTIDWKAHHNIAKEVAAEGVVLLKNDDILPLTKQINIAVIGEFAEKTRFQGGGSSHMNPQQLDKPVDEIKKFANVTFAKGFKNEFTTEELLEEAKKAATGKDAVVLYIGTTDKIESEGFDRTTIKFPQGHVDLVKAVYSVNKNIVIVNQSGAPVELAQVEKYSKAILQAWLPGEAGAAAVAEILFGDICPSGKLGETYPVCIEHTPAYVDFPGFQDSVSYNEGIFVGYRHYDTKKIPVQYPFGHGLSYTTFEYSNMKLSSKVLKNGDILEVSVDIKNVGSVKAKEVVQFYVKDVESLLVRPEKELKGYSKVELLPGETKTVTVKLDERAFAYYVPHLHDFAVETGEFEIIVAASAADIRLIDVVNYVSNANVKPPVTKESYLIEWLNDEETSEVTQKLLKIMRLDDSHEFYPLMVGMPVRLVVNFMGMMGVPKEIVDKLAIAVFENKHISDELFDALTKGQ